MKVKCKVLIEFKSNEEAKCINEAIKIDNENYISTRVIGRFIEAEIETDEILSIVHTLDDFFSCVNEANEIFNQI